jgi:hypothetical protein
VKHNRRRHRRLAALLSRERGQTKPEYTFTLSVISGSTVLACTGFSDDSANAPTGLVRLFV